MINSQHYHFYQYGTAYCTMDYYDIDLKIINVIKKGIHNHNKIFDEIDKGSKTTFGKRIEYLVDSGIIKKKLKTKNLILILPILILLTLPKK